MRIRGKAIESVGPDDILDLVKNGVGESRTLEYKRDLPGRSDAEHKEFLSDLTALANTDGGVIVYGIDTIRHGNTDTGVPEAITGLQDLNADAETRRLTAMADSGVTPSLGGRVIIRAVEFADGAPVLVVGVPRSLFAPHQVTYKHNNRFWRRSEAAKYEPAVMELGAMFLERDAWLSDADRFRRERITQIRELREPPVKIAPGAFIHVLPLGRLNTIVDLRGKEALLRSSLVPIKHDGYSFRFNVDGFQVFDRASTLVDTYVQWFRFGGLEFYCTRLTWLHNLSENRGVHMFDAATLSDALLVGVPEAVAKVFEIFEVSPPYAVTLSLCEAANLMVMQGSWIDPNRRIEQNNIQFAPIILDSLETASIQAQLMPLLDALWQSAGFAGVPR
jgi:hypothetical protein